MKNLSLLLKLASAGLLLLTFVIMILNHTQWLSDYVLSIGKSHFVYHIDVQTVLAVIRCLLIIFFFVALSIDKTNDKRMLFASGTGILGVVFSVAYIPLYIICALRSSDIEFESIYNAVSVVNFVMTILAVICYVLGLLLMYKFLSQKDNMLPLVIAICAEGVIEILVWYVLMGMIPCIYEYNELINIFFIFAWGLLYALLMFQYSRNIDKSLLQESAQI